MKLDELFAECRNQINLDSHRCNRVDNLAWVTPSENIQQAYEKGLAKRGCNHCRAALTYEQVREIRRECILEDLECGVNAFVKKFNK